MEKPIIATTLSGLFIKNTPWKTAHITWFENASKQLKDPKIKEYASIPNYFPKVDEVMARLYPNLEPILIGNNF